MTKEEFFEIAKKAIDLGYRNCFIKKINAAFLFKGNVYLNATGIYKYINGRFLPEATLTEENLLKMEKEDVERK